MQIDLKRKKISNVLAGGLQSAHAHKLLQCRNQGLRSGKGNYSLSNTSVDQFQPSPQET